MAERQPLIAPTGDLTSHTSTADVIFLFPLDSDDNKEGEKTVKGKEFLDAVFVAKNRCRKIFTNLTQLADNDNAIKKKDLTVALIRDLNVFLPSRGFDIKMFKSADEDELFYRIAIDNPEVGKYHMSKASCKVQLNPDVVAKEQVGVKQTPLTAGHETLDPAYMLYSQETVEKVASNFPNQNFTDKNLFKQYYGKYKEGNLFRQVDRIRAIYYLFAEYIDLDDLVAQKIMNAHYPVHTMKNIEDFKCDWGNFKSVFSCEQPLQRIRDYFGEAIAFYFLWVGFTTKTFCWLALLGGGVKIFLVAEPLGKAESREYGTVFFAVMMCLWSTLYTMYWKRTEYSWAAKWDAVGAAESAANRADFVGEMLPDPTNENERSRQYSAAKTKMYKFISSVVMLLFFCCMCSAVLWCFSIREELVDKFGKKGKTIQSVILAVQIKLFNFIWALLAPFLVYLENPRTEVQYANSLVWKLFAVQAINSYNSFFYIAVIQKNTEAGCPKDDCIGFLQETLYSAFMSLCAASVAEMAVPSVKLWMALRSEKKAIEKLYKEKKGGVEVPQRCFMEKQSKNFDYTLEEQITDYMSLIIVMGYVMLFCVVAPGVSVVGLVVLTLQLRADAWKLCSTMKRPQPHRTDGIGAWNQVIDVLNWISLISSVLIPILNLAALEHLHVKEKLVYFFLAEHVLIIIKLLALSSVSIKPAWVSLMQDRREKVRRTCIYGEAADVELKKELQKPAATVPESLKADLFKGLNAGDDAEEWNKVDKGDLTVAKTLPENAHGWM